MAKIRISLLDKGDRVNNLTHKDLYKIYGGDHYIYVHASPLDTEIIAMYLIHDDYGFDTYRHVWPY